MEESVWIQEPLIERNRENVAPNLIHEGKGIAISSQGQDVESRLLQRSKAYTRSLGDMRIGPRMISIPEELIYR